MFELEKAIGKWRSDVLENPNMQVSDADELESHLREQTDSLMLGGLTAEEAFMVSAHRIGDSQVIDREFAKVNPGLAWRRRAFWMLFGILLSMLIGNVAAVCSDVSGFVMTWLNAGSTFTGVMASLVQIAAFVVLLMMAVFGLSLISKPLKARMSVSMILVLCMAAILMLKAASMGLKMFYLRSFSADTIGRVALATNVTHQVWAVLWPIMLIGVLVLLWPSRPYKVA